MIFSYIIKKNITSLSSAELAQRVVMIKGYSHDSMAFQMLS